ncbi:tail protein X [Bradyrhizobium sp. Leo121]|uniref:tail protein X n=1 Tax=Bradyrhizobium sp. Leo121 TaxID=1571195 RepID=UPI001028D899|nr:tail protein X [Bradyrhizobium sp. Leo121]RZN13904.1 phage tail protein [Bradyrhizobium sp. Leo121]
MAVTSYELVTVTGDFVTADLLVWRRYKTPAYGIVEKLLDANPHLARLHKQSPFLPVGTQVRIPIDSDILRGRPQPQQIRNVTPII